MLGLRDKIISKELSLLNELIWTLSAVVGDSGKSEEAVECAQRIINERTALQLEVAQLKTEIQRLERQ